MEQQLQHLARLQNIEIDSRRLKTHIEKISRQFDELDQRLADFKTLMATESRQNDSVKKEYRDYEVTVQDNLGLISKSKEKLSLAKNNKEYQSCLKEIEELENKNSAIEDKMLEILDRLEEAEKKTRAREAEYAVLSDEVAQEREKTNAEIEAKKQELTNFEQGLREAREKIEPDLLETFEKIKQVQVNHIALARVVDAVCQGCNVTIPAQLYNELHRRDSIKFCPKCGRIAYWSEST